MVFTSYFFCLKYFAEHFCFFFKNWVYFFQICSFFCINKVFLKQSHLLAEFWHAEIIVIYWILPSKIYLTVTFFLDILNTKFKPFLKVDSFYNLFFLFKIFCSNTFAFFFQKLSLFFLNLLFFLNQQSFSETITSFGRVLTRRNYRDILNFTKQNLSYCNFLSWHFEH